MPYLECVNEEFQHYFIVDYPTDIPYNTSKKKKKNIFYKLIKKLI